MRSAKTGQPILTTYILYDVDLQADEPFRGVVDNAGHFGGQIPPKNPFWGHEEAFSSQMR